MIMVECVYVPGDVVALRTDLGQVGIVLAVTNWVSGHCTYVVGFLGERMELFEAELARVQSDGKDLNVSQFKDGEGIEQGRPAEDDEGGGDE